MNFKSYFVSVYHFLVLAPYAWQGSGNKDPRIEVQQPLSALHNITRAKKAKECQPAKAWKPPQKEWHSWVHRAPCTGKAPPTWYAATRTVYSPLEHFNMLLKLCAQVGDAELATEVKQHMDRLGISVGLSQTKLTNRLALKSTNCGCGLWWAERRWVLWEKLFKFWSRP